MKFKILAFLILILFIIGCTHESFSFFGGGGKQVAGKGIKIEFLQYPKSLEQNEPFSLGLRLTNFNKNLVQGNLCVFDSPSDRFGGIPQRECTSTDLQSAEEIEGRLIPDQKEYNFPLSGTYSYRNLDPAITHGSVISAVFRYVTETKANSPLCLRNPLVQQSSIPISCPDDESLSMKQPDTPIKVTSVKKSTSRVSDTEVKLKLEIVIKQAEEGDIFNPGELNEFGVSQEQGIEFRAEYGGNPLACSPVIQGKVELREKERLIKCSSIINLNQDFINDNLVVNLRYGFQKRVSTPQIKLETFQDI